MAKANFMLQNGVVVVVQRSMVPAGRLEESSREFGSLILPIESQERWNIETAICQLLEQAFKLGQETRSKEIRELL
jgi:hypothetical protein